MIPSIKTELNELLKSNQITDDYFYSPGLGDVIHTETISSSVIVPDYNGTLQGVKRELNEVICKSDLEFDTVLLYGNTNNKINGFLEVVCDKVNGNRRASLIQASSGFNPSNKIDVVAALDKLIDENTDIDIRYQGWYKKNSDIYVSETVLEALGDNSFQGFNVHKLNALKPGDMLFVPEHEFIEVFYKSAKQQPNGKIICKLGIGYPIDQRPIFHRS